MVMDALEGGKELRAEAKDAETREVSSDCLTKLTYQDLLAAGLFDSYTYTCIMFRWAQEGLQRKMIGNISSKSSKSYPNEILRTKPEEEVSQHKS